jgi:hypothetical protein
MVVKNKSRLGRLQTEMMEYIESVADNGITRFSIHRDHESRRIAASLEQRRLIKVDRDFECWTIRLA